MAMEFEEFIVGRRVAIGKALPLTKQKEIEILDKMTLNGWELTAVMQRHFESYTTYYFRSHRDAGWDDES